MRVLQLVQRAQVRGAEMDALQLGDELERRGVGTRTVYLYGSASESRLPARDRDLHLDARYGSPLERIPGWQPGVLRELLRAVDEFEPRVIQAGGGRTVKYGALVCRRRPDCRLVWRNVGQLDRWLRGPMRRVFYRLLVFPQVDAVVSMTRRGRESFRAVLGEPDIARVIPPGIDPTRIAPLRARPEVREAMGISHDGPVALLIGALSGEKRVDVALRAVANARRTLDDLTLLVAGEGRLRESLEQLARELGLDTAVRFLGQRDDIGDLFAASDLLLISSDTEGLPRAVLEAGFARRPVVATAVGGIPEVIEHESTGLLSPPGNSEELAANIVRITEARGLSATIAESFYRWVTQHATVGAVADEYLRIYEGLVE